MEHVLATYTRRVDAVAAARQARRALPDDATIHVGDTEDVLDALALEQRSEMEGTMPAFSAGLLSGPLARGALLWGLIGLVGGAALTLPISFFVSAGDLPAWQLALYLGLAGALGLASATFVLGAARQAVKEGSTVPEDPTAVVRIETTPEHAEDVVKLLVETGARHTRVVDAPVSRVPSSQIEPPRRPRDDPSAPFTGHSDYNAGFGSDGR
jgi:hypothetical protein